MFCQISPTDEFVDCNYFLFKNAYFNTRSIRSYSLISKSSDNKIENVVDDVDNNEDDMPSIVRHLRCLKTFPCKPIQGFYPNKTKIITLTIL